MAITKDLYTGGGRTFLSTQAAQEFRGLIYQQYGKGPSQCRKAVPDPCHQSKVLVSP